MRKFLLISVVAAVSAIAFMPAGASAASSNADQRVIVELAVPANASAEQITAAADAVLALLPADSYAVTNRYSLIPYLGLTVSPTTLQILHTTPLIVSVHNDGAVAASPGKPAESKPAQSVGAVAGAKSKKCKKSKTKAGMKKYKKCKKAAKQ